MPILTIHVNQECTDNQKQQLLQEASQAVAESIPAPVDNVRISVHTISPQDAIIAGQIGTPMALVNVYLLAGRTEAQKQALIAALNPVIARTTLISDQQIRIVLHDIALTDMGVAGGISAEMAGR